MGGGVPERAGDRHEVEVAVFEGSLESFEFIRETDQRQSSTGGPKGETPASTPQCSWSSGPLPCRSPARNREAEPAAARMFK